MTTDVIERHGTVKRSKEKLAQDLKSVVVDADELLKEVVNSSAEEFAAARTKVEAKLGDARLRLGEARIAVASKACSAADATQEYARENPWKLVGIAAASGFVAAFLLSRR